MKGEGEEEGVRVTGEGARKAPLGQTSGCAFAPAPGLPPIPTHAH